MHIFKDSVILFRLCHTQIEGFRGGVLVSEPRGILQGYGFPRTALVVFENGIIW